MAIIQTIKDTLTNNTIYPITKAGAVYLNDNETTIESTLGDLSAISSIGDGTIADAISTLNDNLIITIPFSATFSNITENAAGHNDIDIIIPSDYTVIGACCQQPDLYNKFIIWIGAVTNTKVVIMYNSLRTDTISPLIKGVVFAKKI